jgi:multidrug resistance efflux pump
LDIKREPPKKRGRYIAIAVGVVVLAGTTFFLSTLESRPPSVDRGTLYIDSVVRGTLTVQVRAPGTLVPEHITFVTAVTSGRVESLPVRPGTSVEPSTVLLVLSNPDVQLELLNAQSSLSSAEANLLTLRTNLENGRLAQQASVANVRTQYENAKRALQTILALDQKGLAGAQEVAAARDLEKELESRLKIEEERLKVQSDAIDEQIRLAKDNVERLRNILKFQQDRVASMRVVAGDSGQLQQLGNGQTQLEQGQWVLAGQTLATVAQPGRLKARLLIPETQAPMVTPGQSAEIDTRNGIVKGRVIRIEPVSQNGTVAAEVSLEGELPRGARAELSVDGTIEIDRLPNVLHVGRPTYGQPNSTVGIFKLDADGKNAQRVSVSLGTASVNTIEVRSGLKERDRIIVSDMSQWDNVSKVRIQ